MESKILKIVEKYNVEIELRYKKSTIVAIIQNEENFIILQFGYIKNLIEDIESECKKIHEQQKKQEKADSNYLKQMAKDKKTFPDNLFKK